MTTETFFEMPSFSSSLNIQLSYEMCNRVGKGHQPLEVQAAKNKRHRPTNPFPPPLLLPTHSHKSLELFGIMRARINEMPSALIRTRKNIIVTKRNIFLLSFTDCILHCTEAAAKASHVLSRQI